jgi:hypothetical protein
MPGNAGLMNIGNIGPRTSAQRTGRLLGNIGPAPPYRGGPLLLLNTAMIF